MKPIDEELLLEQLIDNVKNCKDLEAAKALLFEICGHDAILEKAVDYCIFCHEGQFRKVESLMRYIQSLLLYFGCSGSSAG